MNARVALIVLALVVFGAFAAVAWWYANATSTEPRAVEVRVDATLDSAGAWPLGYTKPAPSSGGVSVEVDARGLDDGRVHLILRANRYPYEFTTELWIRAVAGEPPSALASVHSKSVREDWHGHWLGLEGSVRLSAPRFELAAPHDESTNAVVVEYELTGDDCGSPSTHRGKVVLRVK
ncbi:MAG: hypothetical protein L6Q99_09335 [Planctomycetes bacterium]|nr:hypothetical protein [Planctomycetota bacterium]